jgi:uracil-DNA glycosylase
MSKPDARKPLPVLNAEWEGCTRCALGERRELVHASLIFGEGQVGGIMFVGEGPDSYEEYDGRPFLSPPGMLLRRIINSMSLEEYYLTNALCCRSAEPRTDAEGDPVTDRNGNPAYNDKIPVKPAIDACRPRLMEELYLVDPVVIVGLGPVACEALTGHSFSIAKDRGTPTEIFVPGAGERPVITEKKKVWARRQGGELLLPTEQNKVSYTMIPTLRTVDVLKSIDNLAEGNPFQRFVQDIRLAVDIYNQYMSEVYGVVPREMSYDIPYDLLCDPNDVPGPGEVT